MDKRNLFIFLFILALQANTNNVFAQIDIGAKDYYVWFDAAIGNGNSGIYNGTIFSEIYKTKPDNHRFFLDNTYQLGNLIYDNQTYYNIYLKYDIHDDQLIAKLPYLDNFLFLRLIKEKIDFFELNIDDKNATSKKYSFLSSKANPLVNDESFKGFYQILLKTTTSTLLKKNFKERSEFIDENLVYTKFSDRSYFVLLKDYKYYSINSKKDIIRIFPEQKRYISIFYRRNRKLFKKNENDFYTNLFQDIQLSIHKTEIK
ncbi:hypothetical protein BW723_11210 [Polaribacter reichenbachii]|uniref:Uncharacterized protein n=1 Tax=Polaribacter reichenbachii TaxID=996801 RepID=A0A1B8TPZ3_9FLAO|nr:hypothetical protein [Polaribacter reichenbachii]APZ46817.1 hypothetical protein BW723_11210 [Polaribacter reichenbachii]AUC17460.1 hypothetical protein BTO17_01655 [Polaribacter reichenbachii]OBY61665.1 hypothetical protein LPB301_16555 [Polaribacter reichenbachii]